MDIPSARNEKKERAVWGPLYDDTYEAPSGYKLRPLRHPDKLFDKLLLVTLRFLAPGSTVDPVNCIGCLV
jgi:hypothetical protein